MKDKNDLKLIEKTARKYNAAIAGTRAIVEEGLIEKRCQVGQSGISISPQVYVAIGISGATQHIVGIKNAKKSLPSISIPTPRYLLILIIVSSMIIKKYFMN